MLSEPTLSAGGMAVFEADPQTGQHAAEAGSAAKVRRHGTVLEEGRLDFWQYIAGAHVVGVEFEDRRTESFRSAFGMSTVGDLKIGRFTGVSPTLDHRPELVNPSSTDDYIVLLESSSEFRFEQAGRQRSARGGMVLIDTTQPYFSNHPEKLDVIDVFIPRQVMERALGPARHAAGLSLDASQPSFPVIATFLRSLSQHGAKLDPIIAARMSAIAVDLIASGFAEKLGEAPPRHASSSVMLCRAQAFISDNLGVTGLGMADVAATLNISVRRLHQIAADEGISLVDWMWERRLQRAHKVLADPANNSQSVGAVAFACGFVDQAHFSRRFKRRFGRPPSDLRASSQSDRASPTG